MKCKLQNNSKKNCQANAMENSDYCFFHNPDILDEEKKAVRQQGGKNRNTIISDPLPPIEIKEVSDIVILLSETINQVRFGKMDTKIANCLGVLSGQLIKALEVANLEGKVELLERAILERKVTIS